MAAENRLDSLIEEEFGTTSTATSSSMNASVIDRNEPSRGLSFSEHTPLIPRRRKEPIYVYRKSKMTTLNKICYGLGGAPYELTNTVLGFYITVFLLETAGVPTIYASFIIFFGRIWDAISDPIVGYLVSRTQTRWGQLKPWMTIGTPLAVTTYFCLWFVPETKNLGNKFIWYLVFYCAFQTFLTFYQVPYGTLALCLTDNQEEQESVDAFRMSTELIANVVGNVIMGQSLNYFVNARVEDPECHANKTIVTIPPKVIEVRSNAYVISALTISGLILISAIAVVIGTREIHFIKPYTMSRDERFSTAIKRVLTFKPWLLHVGTFLSFVMALQFITGNFVLFTKYTVGLYEYQNAIILVLASALVFVPIWNKFKTRYGKKSTLGYGMLQSIPMIMVWCIIPHGTVWLQLIMCIILGSCIAVVQVATWAMVPDVIDAFLLETFCSYETTFFTFYVMLVKFAAGSSLGFSIFILGSIAGYETLECDQPETVLLTLRILVTLVPAVLIVCGYFFLWLYPINEEVRQKNQTIMEIWRDNKDERRKQTILKSKDQRNRSRSMRTSTMSFM